MTEIIEGSEQTQPKNLICNFRAPDMARYQTWKDYKKWAQDNGLDICHLTLSLIDSFLKSVQGAQAATSQYNGGLADGSTLSLVTPTKVINIQQNNTFLYSVPKPRREPLALNCARPLLSRTITSRAWCAYVMEKARDLNRSFSYRDFFEIGHDLFRKCVLRLRKEGKIIALPQRTNPRFYVLSERLADYPNVSENIRVKQMFTAGGFSEHT